jgi:PAS domain S-box-containing protein
MAIPLGLLCCEILNDEVRAVLAAGSFPNLITGFYPRHCMLGDQEKNPVLSPLVEMLKICEQVIVIGCGCFSPISIPSEITRMEHRTVLTPDLFRDILLPEGLYESYQREGVFITLPGNVRNWSRFLQCQGFDALTGKEFFTESVNSIVCLDTLIDPETPNNCEILSSMMDIPVTARVTGIRPFLQYVTIQYQELEHKNERERLTRQIREANHKAADYAMMGDLLSEITSIHTEDQVIKKTLDLFTFLISPQKVAFISLVNGRSERIYPQPEYGFPSQDLIRSLISQTDESGIFASNTGFFVKVRSDQALLGILVVENLAIPEYIHEYLDISQIVIRVCGLALVNARSRQQLETSVHDLAEEIEQRKNIEKALFTSEERFRSLVETTSDIIWEVNPQGHYTYVNPQIEKILGYPQMDCIGNSISDYLAPHERDRYFEVLNRHLAEKSSYSNMIFSCLHHDGYLVILETNGEPIIDISGNLKGFRGISRDITERKRTEDALHLASRKIHLLSSITRHDILNSLNAMLAYLDYSLTLAIDNPDIIRYIHEEIHIAQTIQHQIEFTRYYEGIGVNAPQWHALANIITRVAGSLDLGTITLDVDLPNVLIFCDQLIDKVFYNLMENSLRHGEKVTRISLSWFLDNKDLVFVYTDNGVGIALDEKERIFDQGFGKNTGLGMFLTREILSITDIIIRENGNPGEGARFEMVVQEGKFKIAKDDP